MRCAQLPRRCVSTSPLRFKENECPENTGNMPATGFPITLRCFSLLKNGNEFERAAKTRSSRGVKIRYYYMYKSLLLLIISKDINMATMRSTWEARRQLSEILYNFGFPEEVLVPQGLSNDLDDDRLDCIISYG